MGGDIEMGDCNVCKKLETQVLRKCYRYDVKCDCCNSKNEPHFEIVYYCPECTPIPPRRIKATLEPIKE